MNDFTAHKRKVNQEVNL
uniref:Uncharacterized protein n=1 Tax=Arundo donax TaxID=35708 RepID=A0A0A8YSW8_ARUDO